MTKLSDTQAIILSAAAQREDRIALPLPGSLRGGAAAKVVGAMLAKGFLEEVDADMRKGEPVWRETGDGSTASLDWTQLRGSQHVKRYESYLLTTPIADLQDACINPLERWRAWSTRSRLDLIPIWHPVSANS